MRLLIVTQKVNETDPVLGFFVTWLREFAKHVDRVTVICLEKGTYSLPENVHIYSLGKENGRASSFTYALRFLSYTWKLRTSYDAVFVHMNPEYVCIAGWLWRLLGKRVALWYLHKSVTWKLRIATLWANVILTASSESLRLSTKKKHIIGHGIDLRELMFLPAPATDMPIQLVTVGRLSPIKRVEFLIDALRFVRDTKKDVRLVIVGGPATVRDEKYKALLVQQIQRLGLSDFVHFVGPVAHDALPQYFKNAHLFVHASDTGSLDKAILEPLAVGVPVITTSTLPGSAGVSALMTAEPNAESIAAHIETAIEEFVWKGEVTRSRARAYVQEHHSLEALIPKIVQELTSS